jgi:hypothetical protein
MDPLEERDIEKILQALDDSRVQEKIAELFVVLPHGPYYLLVPKKNVVQPEEEPR